MANRTWENFNKEMENIFKNNQFGEYNNWSKKYTIKINNRQYDSEEWISDLEDRVVEIT